MLEGGTSRRSDHHQSKANHLSYFLGGGLKVWMNFAFWEVLSPTTGLVGKHDFFIWLISRAGTVAVHIFEVL